MRRVLVTRPEPGASATAARLEAMGFAPVVLPLTQIVAMVPDKPARCDAVIATSPNALRNASAEFLAPLLDRRLFAVGEATASAARRAGFDNVVAAAGTAIDLAALIGQEMAAGASLLHIAGRERTQGFEQDLERRGFMVEIVETYRADEIIYQDDYIIEHLSGAPLWGALALSERAGMMLAALTQRPQVGKHFEKTRFFCISAKVGATLGSRQILVAEQPSEEAVLALLSSRV